MRLPQPLLQKASTALCVCLYPVSEQADGSWIATDSGGRQLYVADYDGQDLVVVRRLKRTITIEDIGGKPL
jgi:hypothetical protein